MSILDFKNFPGVIPLDPVKKGRGRGGRGRELGGKGNGQEGKRRGGRKGKRGGEAPLSCPLALFQQLTHYVNYHVSLEIAES
jgi:hypothetical protein